MSTAKHRLAQKDLKSFELLGSLTPDKLDELDAFIALDEYSYATADAGVWLYKPYSDVVEPPSGTVSEPATLALSFAALGMMMWRSRRRKATSY